MKATRLESRPLDELDHHPRSVRRSGADPMKWGGAVLLVAACELVFPAPARGDARADGTRAYRAGRFAEALAMLRYFISTSSTSVGVVPMFSPMCDCAGIQATSPALNSRTRAVPSASVSRRWNGASA